METINDLGEYTFPALLKNSVKKFGDRPALSLIGKPPYTYQQIKDISENISKMLKVLGLKEGSKIAILSTGRPLWGISYFGIVNYGMIAVPLLPDSHSKAVRRSRGWKARNRKRSVLPHG